MSCQDQVDALQALDDAAQAAIVAGQAQLANAQAAFDSLLSARADAVQAAQDAMLAAKLAADALTDPGAVLAALSLGNAKAAATKAIQDGIKNAQDTIMNEVESLKQAAFAKVASAEALAAQVQQCADEYKQYL